MTPVNRQIVGNFAISQIQCFRAYQAMIEQAESLTIIADSSKLGRIASFKVCGLDRITNLVCDQYPSEKIKSALLKANINIICAN